MVLFDRTSVRSGIRRTGLSSSMFFVRNCPHPQRVKHIEGLNGAMVCNVNDDLSRNRPKRGKSSGYHKNNLPTTETTRRVERLIPPTDFWHAHGVLHDTDEWRKELASLASASGVGLDKDERKHSNRAPATADDQHASRAGAHYSTRTGRFNEGTGKSRGRTGTRHGTGQLAESLVNVPENEREMWMLQVLCQILNTCNLEDVQTWLVSASPTEKEQARSMITSALRGLKEADRTSANDAQDSTVDFDSLSNLVERQRNEEQYAAQKYVSDTLNRSAPVLPSDDVQQPEFGLNDTWDLSGVTNSYIYPETKKHRSHSQHAPDNEEQIDTIQLIDDRQRSRSPSLTNQSQNYDSPRAQPMTNRPARYPVDSIEFNDDANSQGLVYLEEFSEEKSKSRKIRDLQNKLSRQEEDSKKKFDELQTKQSRLENAIRLLAKQTSANKKSQKDGSGQPEDAPVVNVIIQSPHENGRRRKPSKARATPFIHAESKTKNSGKAGDFNVEDVKVQINLSRLDNQQPKSYGGVWKHDAQTLQRFQAS